MGEMGCIRLPVVAAVQVDIQETVAMEALAVAYRRLGLLGLLGLVLAAVAAVAVRFLTVVSALMVVKEAAVAAE